MDIPPLMIQAKERRQMNQTVNGSGSQPYHDYLTMKMEREEATAQSETLRGLGNAIRQYRRLLELRHDYVAKIELTIPMR